MLDKERVLGEVQRQRKKQCGWTSNDNGFLLGGEGYLFEQ